MVAKRKTFCSYPGCREIVEAGRCTLHAPDVTRATASERGYGWAWAKPGGLRLLALQRYPVCVQCGRVATDADHITPKRAGGGDTLDNLQGLCHACHSRKTAGEKA